MMLTLLWLLLLLRRLLQQTLLLRFLLHLLRRWRLLQLLLHLLLRRLLLQLLLRWLLRCRPRRQHHISSLAGIRVPAGRSVLLAARLSSTAKQGAGAAGGSLSAMSGRQLYLRHRSAASGGGRGCPRRWDQDAQQVWAGLVPLPLPPPAHLSSCSM